MPPERHVVPSNQVRMGSPLEPMKPACSHCSVPMGWDDPPNRICHLPRSSAVPRKLSKNTSPQPVGAAGSLAAVIGGGGAAELAEDDRSGAPPRPIITFPATGSRFVTGSATLEK